jgi:hypothetical protein
VPTARVFTSQANAHVNQQTVLHSSHGLTSITPADAKSAVFLVMTYSPWRSAVAAIRPLTAGTVLAAFCAAAVSSPHRRAVSRSMGSSLSA